MNLDMTWGAARDSNYGSFDNYVTNQSAMASFYIQSVALVGKDSVMIDKVNVDDLLSANLDADEVKDSAVLETIGLDDHEGKYSELVTALAAI